MAPVECAGPIGIDCKSICSIDYECTGRSEVSKCCCAKFDVCVSDAELKRIIPVLPEVSKFCPHLKTDGGYANIFEDAENGLHAIDTHENGLCVFAFKRDGLIRCSLHAVEMDMGLPLGTVKPQMCVLWPLTFSEKGDVLTLHDQALSCECSCLRKKPSSKISSELLQIIDRYRGERTKK